MHIIRYRDKIVSDPCHFSEKYPSVENGRSGHLS